MATTLLQLVKMLAEETGEFGSYTTTALGTTTTLVCSTLTGGNLVASSLENAAILIEDGAQAGAERYVRTASGLTVSTGTITVTDAFDGAIASGVTFSVFVRLPAYRRLQIPGYREIINQALRRVRVQDEITFSGVNDRIHYEIDTATYPWWTDPASIVDVYAPVTNSDHRLHALSRSAWEWRDNGETRQLVFRGAPFRTGETFTVKVMRLANSRLKISGTWTDQTNPNAGLTGLTDETLAHADDVLVFAKARLYATLAELHAPGAEVAEWAAKAEIWDGKAARRRAKSVPKDRRAGIVNLRSGYASRTWWE